MTLEQEVKDIFKKFNNEKHRLGLEKHRHKYTFGSLYSGKSNDLNTIKRRKFARSN